MSAIIIASAAAATAISAAVHLRPCLIHRELPSAGIFTIQPGNCLFGFFGVGHLHKPKSTRTASGAVCYNRNAVYRSKRLEKGPQLSFCQAEREITYKYLLHGWSLRLPKELRSQQK